jgi:hypothetical protein
MLTDHWAVVRIVLGQVRVDAVFAEVFTTAAKPGALPLAAARAGIAVPEAYAEWSEVVGVISLDISLAKVIKTLPAQEHTAALDC